VNEASQGARDAFLGGTTPGTGVLRGARNHGTGVRRRDGRRRRRVLGMAGTAVAAGGVTAALLAASGSGAPSALAAVAAALAKTSAQSYRFSLGSTVQARGQDMGSDVVTGAINPGRELGTELVTTSVEHRPVTGQIRFIGRYEYTRVSPWYGGEALGRPWDKAAVPSARTSQTVGTYGFVSDQPVSPAELSGVLHYAATVRDAGPASGPGWTGTRYTFAASLAGRQGSVSGTVYVDRQGRVRRLVTTTTQGTVTTDRDLVFGDYGAPVPVTAPPPGQARYTSQPSWGFFF
jgi:hypothetical protein